MSITAVITTYNRSDVLPRAINSVLQQTLPADEVIIVDDGSSDDTQRVLEPYKNYARLIHQKNAGISHTRNTAIKLASSDWIAFLDDDDEWLPDKLEKQHALIQQFPDYRLCHGEEIWIRNGKRVNAMHKHKKQGGWIYPQCLPLCVISPSAVMIHREIFDTIGLFDNTLPACEDYDLWLRICAQFPVLFVEEPVIKKYGGHSDQLSRKYWGMDRFRIQAMENILQAQRLSDENQKLTLEMLITKISIFIKGSRKRNKQDEADHYQQKLDLHQAALNELQAQGIAC